MGWGQRRFEGDVLPRRGTAGVSSALHGAGDIVGDTPLREGGWRAKLSMRCQLLDICDSSDVVGGNVCDVVGGKGSPLSRGTASPLPVRSDIESVAVQHRRFDESRRRGNRNLAKILKFFHLRRGL